MTYYLVNGRWVGPVPPNALEQETILDGIMATAELRSRQEAAAGRIVRRRFRAKFTWERSA